MRVLLQLNCILALRRCLCRAQTKSRVQLKHCVVATLGVQVPIFLFDNIVYNDMMDGHLLRQTCDTLQPGLRVWMIPAGLQQRSLPETGPSFLQETPYPCIPGASFGTKCPELRDCLRGEWVQAVRH